MVLGFSSCFVWLAFSLAPLCSQLDQRAASATDQRAATRAAARAAAASNKYAYTRRYQQAALAVLLAILSWVTDNLGCRSLQSLPYGLPYPQLVSSLGLDREGS